MSICIDLTWRLRKPRPAGAKRLIEAAEHALRAEGFRKGELSLVVVGEKAMATLHDRYMSDPTPTDVLTFDLGTDRKSRLVIGEIVVCADVARKEVGRAASAQRWLAELCLYVVHGALHLAGYDDHDPAEFTRMHAREDKLLRQLGFGAVFHQHKT